ncbi:MAG: hypothetical protein ACUVQ5_03185 [Candidatus Methanomethylicaceae archaeon]
MNSERLARRGLDESALPEEAVLHWEIDGLDRAEFSKTVVLGAENLRQRMMMELAIRNFESGERLIIIDLKGRYAPLIDYIPSLRIYKVGEHATFNPLKERFRGYAWRISSIFGALYGLSRDERLYFAKALEGLFRDGKSEPSMDDVFERLLQMEAEVQPKEGYKIECLKNVLWEAEGGRLGSAIKGKEKELRAPMIIDMGLLTPHERVFMMVSLLMKLRDWNGTCLIIDGMDWSRVTELGEPKMAIKEGIEEASRAGTMVFLGAETVLQAPVIGTAYIFCGPIWWDEIRWIEGIVRERGVTKALRYLEEGTGLVLTWKRPPFYLRHRLSSFREVDEKEVKEHMITLGEEVEFIGKGEEKEKRMLEKIFKDRASLFYAKEFLRLVGEGKVPVEALKEQKNSVLKNAVRVLKRYFMVVEYMDGSGVKWYRLTKVGENALRQIEGEEDEG